MAGATPSDVFYLLAKLKVDTSEFKSGMEDAQKTFDGSKDKIKSGLGALKDGFDVLAGATVAALGAAATGIGAMVKQSVDAYGSYEQLAGGVQTIFGESAQTVLANSEEAYRTAGMSMNEYMETSIQSAAALINSLSGDQAKAAELMDMSIIDMSDNVNKMGTTMQSVQDAYRGFSRGNFTIKLMSVA